MTWQSHAARRRWKLKQYQQGRLCGTGRYEHQESEWRENRWATTREGYVRERHRQFLRRRERERAHLQSSRGECRCGVQNEGT